MDQSTASLFASGVTRDFLKLETLLQQMYSDFHEELVRRGVKQHRRERELLEEVDDLQRELELWRNELKYTNP